MSATLLAEKMRVARKATSLAAAVEKLSLDVMNRLPEVPSEDRLRISRTLRNRLAELDLGDVDADMLTRHGAGWASAVDDLAASDQTAAIELARRMWAWLSRSGLVPEMPRPLDCGVEETETPPTAPHGGTP